MPAVELSNKHGSIPIIYVRGTYYEVGFQIGRTFRSMVQSYLKVHTTLNSVLIPLYETDEGKAAYKSTLAAMMKDYPQYVKELEGTADGAEVPFHQLFLLHMDDILPGALSKLSSDVENTNLGCASHPHTSPVQAQNLTTDNGNGCSTVSINIPGQEILAHNEDALRETLNHFYFVSAHIVSDKPQGKWKVTEERFTSLCYAGNLPGFTISYNEYGFLYTVNIICVNELKAGKTPRTFLTRSLLAARNYEQAIEMMLDKGTGIGNGVSLNMILLNKEPIGFYNAEISPPPSNENESVVSIVPVKERECFYHCNRFLRLNTPETSGLVMESSICRHEVMNKFPQPKNEEDVRKILGDDSHTKHPLYRNEKKEMVATIATGIFNCKDMTLSIYSDNPKRYDPLFVLPLKIQKA